MCRHIRCIIPPFFLQITSCSPQNKSHLLQVTHRALCVFGQLEAAADALHHLLDLISSGEAAAATAAATTPAHGPANQSSQPHGPAPSNPHGQSLQSLPTAQQSEGLYGSCEAASASTPAAQAQSGHDNQPQALGEPFVLVNSLNSALQPASQQNMQAKRMSQHPLQHQLPTHGQPPSDPPTQHQQATHQPKHSQQVFSQQARSQPPRQDTSQQHKGMSPAQSEHAAASQGCLLQVPQHRREARRHAGLPYFQLKLIREACHTVMTLAEKRGQPALMLPLLQRMQQVCKRHPIGNNNNNWCSSQ